MACLVSLCSFTHFTSHETLIQELESKVEVEVPSLLPLFTSFLKLMRIRFVASEMWIEELRSMKLCRTPDVAHFRQYCGGVFVDYKVVCSSSPRVISGFWVGPDVEDGWGFVEAVVNQISDF
ncbi:hypothetical protein Ccrd_019972 [Cynara cardunculus var. scolymus]|uniref:Uncharacterized protein n=1 Tax=Cynara cardunculus var. scolymus TaxID=59895 RepID=A0A103Y3A7_CYNCS|nr:hypothetical protein Ccrd_019972 [Cynara cardunculus var. scolymus]